jgi:hypothetical protein
MRAGAAGFSGGKGARMTIHTRILPSALLGASLALAGAAQAGFKCAHNQIVEEGESTVAVREKCGAPKSEETLTTAGGEVVTQRWVYTDPSDRRWIKILEFRDGVLQAITGIKP